MLNRRLSLTLILLIYFGPIIQLALMLGLAWPPPTLAQFSDNIDISLLADKDTLTVGDPIVLTLTVKHPHNYQVIYPKLEETWGDFEVWSQSEPLTQANDEGGETTHQVIEATLFAVGTFQTPPLQVTLRDDQGQTLERAVPQISLTVASVLPEDDATGQPDDPLRDLKPQASLPVPSLWPWIVISFLILIALLVLLVWFYLRLYS